MTDSHGAPTAGWYTDPADAAQLRWWTGGGWSAETRPAAPPVPAVVAVERTPVEVAPATPAAPAFQLPESMPAFAQQAAQLQPHSQPQPTYLAPEYRVGASWIGSPQTAGIWLLACLPTMNLLVTVVIGSAMAAAASGVLPMETQTIAGIAALGVLPFAWLFAFLDRRALSRRGFAPPSILWMLLLPPLAYFIARGRAVRRAGGRAWPPELLYFLQVAGGILLSIGVVALGLLFARSAGVVGPDATPQYGTGIVTVQDRTLGPLPQRDELWIEASDAITADLVAEMPQVYVDCGTSEPIVELGSTFPCLAFDLDDPATSAELSATIDRDGVLAYSVVG